ncbi:MAG TPA: tRNA 2-selenouridine(34) synthase MnmH [Gallionellaceae bacterium]|nr:tRNA 2-selenouridine(34) synthase MnmH [Gallionellaceae bacterium]
MRNPGIASIEQLHEFDEIIDVRTPLEFAEDHVPGAINCPVLSNEERVRVGTLYKESSFEAKKIGAALIARNIAQHIEERWLGKPKNWHPLIYCWRGGQRSGSMVHILRQIGFAAERLEGGYKHYRQHVLEQLAIVPAQLSFRVVCGLTGSGKSRLLQALREAGAQVLDLEEIARHRGSVLGDMPNVPQPAQKGFDSEVLAQLQAFDPARPIYVESESRKIGMIRVPEALIDKMWISPCLRLETPAALRVALLREDYLHFLHDPALLRQQLERLKGMYSNEELQRWHDLCDAGQWDEFVAGMLERHYDPAYSKSIYSHYPNYEQAPQLHLKSLDHNGFLALAKEALAMPDDFVNNGNKAPL